MRIYTFSISCFISGGGGDEFNRNYEGFNPFILGITDFVEWAIPFSSETYLITYTFTENETVSESFTLFSGTLNPSNQMFKEILQGIVNSNIEQIAFQTYLPETYILDQIRNTTSENKDLIFKDLWKKTNYRDVFRIIHKGY